MICTKCNHKLPDDSEFCQYCGNKIENTVAEVSETTQENDISIVPKNEKPKKVKYCSHCGSPVDSDTKVCTGCGKQYFKMFKINSFYITMFALVLAIVTVPALLVFQHIKTQELKDEISRLENQVNTKQTIINRLENENNDLKEEKKENSSKLEFFDNYVEIIADDGTNIYHKWECSRLDISNGFWIFNTETAEARYYKCMSCH